MKRKIGILLLMALSTITFLNVNVSACTIFTQCDGSLVLVGNNEDWMYSYDSMYWVVQGNDEEYSRICFGISGYVQGGMNEKGLFYDGAACPKSEIPYDKEKEQLGMDAGERVLAKCATVKEAVEFLENYNISSSLGDHLMFVDSSGSAAVVEWLENEMRVVWAEDNKMIATNFYLSNPELGGYPCDRYDMAEEILNGSDSLSVPEFSDILFSTAQNWGDGGTKYSNVYDLKALTVYVYQMAEFSKVAVINLQEELEKLGSGESNIGNIYNLSYQETLSVLGREIVSYKQPEENSQIEKKNQSDIPLEEEKSESDILYVFPLVIGVIGIGIIVYFYKKRNSK